MFNFEYWYSLMLKGEYWYSMMFIGEGSYVMVNVIYCCLKENVGI